MASSEEMNVYEKLSLQNVQPHDIYTSPMETVQASPMAGTSAAGKSESNKMSCTSKLLIAGVIVNFLLLILCITLLAFFLARTASKSEVDSISQQATTSLQEMQGPSGPPGPIGSSGAKGDRSEAGQTGIKGGKGMAGPKGDLGAQGVKGDRGITGPPGTPGGAQGVKGDRGMTGPPGLPAPVVGGVTYNRWGNSNCRSGVDRVYAGRTGVTSYRHKGGAANYLCMPNDPQYTLQFRPGVDGRSFVYGTEYEETVVSDRAQHNVPCAVCYIPTGHTVIMIPAKTTCPSGWVREYFGYLMSEAIGLVRTMYECVDNTMDTISGSQADIVGGHFYHVEVHCTGFTCPPYDEEKELNCVVCSR